MGQHPPPLTALRAFEAAARHGSFALAATELNVTPAAVSHRVKALEDSLGVLLFERRPRGVVVTETGKRYREQVASAFAILERATAEVDRAAVDGPLTVSMPQSFAGHWLIPRLGRLRERFPGLALTIDGSSRLVDFRAGQADAAIRFGAGSWDGLDSQLLCGDAVTVLAPAQAVRAPSDTRVKAIFRNATLLEDRGVTAAEEWMQWAPWLREAGLQPSHSLARIRFGDSSLALRAAVHGEGLCLGRLSFALDAVRQRELVPVFDWRMTGYAYYLVTRPADCDNPRIAAFMTWLAGEISRYVAEVRDATSVELRSAGMEPAGPG